MNERWGRLTELFAQAVALEPSAREQFLSQACAADQDTRADVEALLRADAACPDDSFLRTPIAEAVDTLCGAEEQSRVGQVVGVYQLTGELGRGGMGRVYLARRADEQYRAEVAIKFVQGAFGSPELLSRFRAERQILADLDHPNIARLLDGGSTEDGSPYLVMERVSGQPIDRYADSCGLGIRDRVGLLLKVAGAVQHAHQSLIVHRDLKPSNILVTSEGEPKLLDFGIAKLLDPTGAELETTHLRALTPAYASPEQVRGARVTVATDVYSLGVVLYRMLTGREPFQLRGLSPGEVEQVLAEVDPEPPSLAVKRSEPQPGHPPAWSRQLRGDLDTIILRALGKTPADRYPSIAALAEDLRRYLEGQPVLARRATVGYRVHRFLRRHRREAIVALLALAGVVGSTSWYLVRVARERDRARQEGAKAAEVASFLRGLFEVSDPSRSRGETVTARELLDQGAARVEQGLADQPAVQAEMMRLIGEVYQGLGLTEAARPLIAKALQQHLALHPRLHPDVASSQIAYGVLLQDVGALAEAEPLLREGLAARLQLFGPVSPEVSEAQRHLADLFEARGELAAAESLSRSALALDRQLYAADDPRVINAVARLGGMLRRLDRLDEAEPLLREALAAQRRQHGDRDLRVASTARNLAALLRDKREFAESERLYTEVLATRRAILGEVHPEVATTLNSYALLLSEEGRTEEAIAASRQFVSVIERLHPGPHPTVAAANNNLAFALLEAGLYDEAELRFRRSMRIQDGVFRPDHPSRAHPFMGLAAIRMAGRRFAAAEPLLRRAVALRRQGLAAGHRETGEALSELGACLTGLRRFAAAESALVEAHQILKAAVGVEDRRTQRATRRLVDLFDQWQAPDQANRYRLELPVAPPTSP